MHTSFSLGLLFWLASMSTSYMVYLNGSKPVRSSEERHVQLPPEHQQTSRQTSEQLFDSNRVESENQFRSVEKKSLLQNQQPFYLTNFESYKFPIEPQKLKTHKTYKHRSYTVDYADSYPKYKFEYGVHDSDSGDFKSHKEERDGDVVRGCYELVEPGGARRVVSYTSDKDKGFVAVVHQEGPSQHEEVPYTSGDQEEKSQQEQMPEQLIQNDNGYMNNPYPGEHKTQANHQQEYFQEHQEHSQKVDKQHEQESYKSQITLNNQYYQLQQEPQNYPQQQSHFEEEQENNKHVFKQQFRIKHYGYKPQMTSNNQYYQQQQESLEYPQQESHAEEQKINKQDYQQKFQINDNGYDSQLNLYNQDNQLQPEPQEYSQQEPQAEVHQQNNKQQFRQIFQINNQGYQPQMTSNNQYYHLQQEPQEYPHQESQAKVDQQNNNQQFRKKFQIKDQGYQLQMTANNQYYQLQQGPEKYPQQQSQVAQEPVQGHQENNKEEFRNQFQDARDQVYESQTSTDQYYQPKEPQNYH